VIPYRVVAAADLLLDASDQEVDMAPLSEKERDALPDKAFAFPKQRKEPLLDANHVRSALARFDQVEGVTDDERDAAFRRIRKAAEKYDVKLDERDWRELRSR
jgi:hypothetical protein